MSYLRDLHARFQDLEDGVVADYIPELAKADPRAFGISVATVDGYVYEVGDTRVPFTIQSISKPFVYGLALEDRGKAAVLERVGVEPTGDAFNEISLAPETGRPRNPMINAGAIASTSIVTGRSVEDRWDRILGLFSMYAGRQLSLNERVYASERDTGHRNRAISHMLRNFDIIDGDPEPDLDLYFRQCSIDVTCTDLSVMAAALAAGGVNPVTGERVLQASNVDELLSVMTTCGMYDYAGEWVYRVGLPAKSGVTGGILAVLPGQLGISVYSPPLDARGNSVRGVEVCRAMSDDLELHFLRAPRAGLSSIRSETSLRRVRSKRLRSIADEARLAEIGGSVDVFELQGDLTFGTIERVVRRIFEESSAARMTIIDVSHNHDIDPTAAGVLLDVLRALHELGRQLVFVGLGRHPRVRRHLEEQVVDHELAERGLTDHDAARLVTFDALDLALEYAENVLLYDRARLVTSPDELSLAKHEIARGLDAGEVRRLSEVLERRDFRAREMLIRKGDAGGELLILVRGELSVMVDSPWGKLRRLSTLSTGMSFGELSLLDRGPRTAFVRADCDGSCWALGWDAFEALGESTPKLKIKLLENMMRSSARIAARLTTDIGRGAS